MFNQRGVATEYLHFPRFDAPVYGDLIARFLRGDLGTVEGVNPYLVALLYAGDRADAAKTINGWLAEGKVVIVDRYVYSNIGYQCAKLPAGKERDTLREWILRTEFEEFAIPRPDVSLFLDVPFSFTERKLTETREGDDRSYLQGGKDIHEAMDNVMEYMTVNGEEDLIYVLLEPWGTNIVPLSKEALNKVEKEYIF